MFAAEVVLGSATKKVDHLAVLAQCNLDLSPSIPRLRSLRRLGYSRMGVKDAEKAEHFRQLLDATELPSASTDVESHHAEMQRAIRSAAAKAFPKGESEPRAPWIGSAAWSLRTSRCYALKQVKWHGWYQRRLSMFISWSAWKPYLRLGA